MLQNVIMPAIGINLYFAKFKHPEFDIPIFLNLD